MSKSQEYVKHLFSDKLVFEKEVLHVTCDEDRKDVMQLICTELCQDDKVSKQINFLKIKSINELNFDGVTIALVQILLAELISLLKERRYTRAEIDAIKKNKLYLKFLYELSQTYMRRFSTLFFKGVVDTFFELVGLADKPDKPSPLVLEVINGNAQRPSLLEQHGGGQILYKPEQAWMRVKQAKDDKNRQIQKYQLEIVRLVRRIDELKLHISAIVAARALSMSDINKVTPSLLLDMFTDDEDVQLHTKKTMFSYVPSGELSMSLIQLASRASAQAEDVVKRGEYKQISSFFSKCNQINTEKYVKERFEEFKHELEVKSNRYRDQRLKLKTIRDRPLDSFDVTLKKVKEAMVFNLQHLKKDEDS